MAQGIGIYQLPEVDTLTGAESIPVDTGADTKRATVTTIRSGLQPESEALTALAAAGVEPDTIPFYTDDGADRTALTAFARSLLAGTSAAAVLSLLGALGTAGNASSTTVLQTPAGATRSLAALFSDSTNAISWGAKGDAATDDTARLQAAISRGGEVVLPKGAFRITAALTVPTDTVVRGHGVGTTRIIAATPDQDVFTVGDGVTMVENVTICDLSIDVVGGVTKTAGAAVRLNKTSDCRIRNLVILNQAVGLRLTDSTLPRCADIYIINPKAGSGGGGVLIDGSTGNDHCLRNVFVAGGTVPEYGFRLRHTGATWLDNCGAILCTDGMVIDPQAGQSVEHLFSQRCAWDTSAANGMKIAPAAGGKVQRCKFIGDWTSTNTAAGIHTTGAGTIDDIEFSAHRSLNNRNDGVLLEAGANIRFTGGTISGNSGAASNTYDGVRVKTGVSGVMLTGMRIGPVAGFGDIQRYGVKFDPGSTNYQIIGCDLRGNLSGALNDSGNGPRQFWGNLPAGIAQTTSSLSMLFPSGTACEIVQRPAVPHSAGNQGVMAVGFDDGGGVAGLKVFNTHDGTFSSQETTIFAAKGGAYASTERWRWRGDGTVWTLANTRQLMTTNGILIDPAFTVATVPSASPAGQRIYVSNESGGAVPAFSDGTNWRRVTDRAVIS